MGALHQPPNPTPDYRAAPSHPTVQPFRQVRWRPLDGRDGWDYGQVDYADRDRAAVYPFPDGHVLVWLGAEIDELEVRPLGAPSMHPGTPAHRRDRI